MGIFLSTDGGSDWKQIKIRNDTGSCLEVAAFDPSNRNTIYVAGYKSSYAPALHKSTDGGASWTELTPPSSSARIEAIAVDPSVSGTIYLGTSWAGIFVSTNGGDTWTKLENGPWGCNCIAINESNPNEIFAGNWSFFSYSNDKGATWTDISEGLPVRGVTSIEIDGAARQVYVGTSGGGILRRDF